MRQAKDHRPHKHRAHDARPAPAAAREHAAHDQAAEQRFLQDADGRAQRERQQHLDRPIRQEPLPAAEGPPQGERAQAQRHQHRPPRAAKHQPQVLAAHAQDAPAAQQDQGLDAEKCADALADQVADQVEVVEPADQRMQQLPEADEDVALGKNQHDGEYRAYSSDVAQAPGAGGRGVERRQDLFSHSSS